ncbi:TPA: hypothetical protein ACIZCU_001921 [Legionella pneumophila]|nr:hypothetical protein [Legionella pneumophila]
MNNTWHQTATGNHSILSDLRLSRALLNVIFIIALSLLLIINIISYNQVKNLLLAINWVSQSYEIIQSIDTCLYEVVSIESRQRFYLIRDSNDQHMVDMKKMKAENLRSAISKLHVKYGAQPVGQITASIGISVYADDAKSHRTD